MKTSYEKSISILNDLIETCKDGQHGFLDRRERCQRRGTRVGYFRSMLRNAGITFVSCSNVFAPWAAIQTSTAQ